MSRVQIMATVWLLTIAMQVIYINCMPTTFPNKSVQACGRDLADVLQKYCSYGYNNYSTHDQDSPPASQRRNKRGIIEECCHNACSWSDLLSYCYYDPSVTTTGKNAKNDIEVTTKQSTNANGCNATIYTINNDADSSNSNFDNEIDIDDINNNRRNKKLCSNDIENDIFKIINNKLINPARFQNITQKFTKKLIPELLNKFLAEEKMRQDVRLESKNDDKYKQQGNSEMWQVKKKEKMYYDDKTPVTVYLPS